MIPEQLVKGKIYYAHSKTSDRAYIFMFLQIRMGILITSSDRPIELGSSTYYHQNSLIGVSNIDILRPATSKEVAFLNEKISYNELMQDSGTPKKFTIRKNLTINFKL